MSGGKPTLSAISCSCGVGNIDIDIHGSLGWIYNWVIGVYKETILSTAQQSVGATGSS